MPVTTALQRLPPRAYLAGRTFQLTAKTRLDLEALRAQLVLAGYHHVQQVMSPGEFCVRGGLIDLFPTGSAVPYRLDLLGDEIETIRTFDVDTQRSIYPVSEVRMLPAREFPLDEEGRAHFRESFRERFEGDPTRSRVYKDVSNGIAPAGVECYLPLFFEATATLFDYLPRDRLLVMHGDVPAAAEAFWKDLKSRYDLLRGDRDRPLLEPRELYMPVEDLFVALKELPRIDDDAPTPAAWRRQESARPGPAIVEVDRRSIEPLKPLKSSPQSFAGRARSSSRKAPDGARRSRRSSPSTASIRRWWTTGAASSTRRIRRPSPMARSPRASCCPARASPSSPRPSSIPGRCARRAAATRARSRAPKGWCAISPR